MYLTYCRKTIPEEVFNFALVTTILIILKKLKHVLEKMINQQFQKLHRETYQNETFQIKGKEFEISNCIFVLFCK